VSSVHPAGTGLQQEAQISRYGGKVVDLGLVLGTIVTVFRPPTGTGCVVVVAGLVVDGFAPPDAPD
jgi:hypothetical protein